MFYIKNITHNAIYNDKYDTLDEAIHELNQYMHEDEVRGNDMEYSIHNTHGYTVFHSHTGTRASIAEMLAA